MSPGAARLPSRVLLWQLVFTLGTAGMLALVPRLLLLRDTVAADATRALVGAAVAGSAIGMLRNLLLLRRHRFLLRVLALGSRSVEGYEVRELSDDVWRVTANWLAPQLVGLGLVATVLRPSILDLTTGGSVALVAAVFAGAAALSLQTVVRVAFVRAIDLAPPDALGDVVRTLERSGLPRRRTSQRLLVAVAMPVALVAIGSALIANAHVRRADERQREETARVLARVALEPIPGVVPAAGLSDAVRVGQRVGFSGRLSDETAHYRVARDENGVVELTAPLDHGSARVRFSGSTVAVLSPASALAALLAVAIAALLGAILGRALADDLYIATRGVRLLGTEAVISGGTRVMRPARFKDVEELGRAIERLADRFRIFARAQERSIAARERAARMRGLFFASVSHDLKSPLNAILGFTALVRDLEPLEAEQAQSLDLIERRGRELLALIETILDAARVEAKQLNLVREPVDLGDLVSDAITKGRDLSADPAGEVVAEINEGAPTLYIDRARVARAIATLIGHAVRSADRGWVRLRAGPSRTGGARIDVEVPSTRLSAAQLEAMLDPARAPGRDEHRGLALGLGLARAVIDLHGGSISVADRADKGSVFTVRLPAGSDGALAESEPP